MGGDFLQHHGLPGGEHFGVVVAEGAGKLWGEDVVVIFARHLFLGQMKQLFEAPVHHLVNPVPVLQEDHGGGIVQNGLEAGFQLVLGTVGLALGGEIAGDAQKAGGLPGVIPHDGDGEHHRQPAAVLAEVSPLVFVRRPEEGFGYKGMETDFNGEAELLGQSGSPAGDLLWIVEDRGAGLPDDLRGLVAQKLLGTDVESLDDAIGATGDDGEVGPVQHGALQGALGA